MVAAGAAHAALGVAADRLLDPSLPASVEGLPTLDSQNRFYGAMFGVIGSVVWQAAGDLERYWPIISTTLVGFTIAGLARMRSASKLGWPAPAVVSLLVIEVVIPPCMLLWGSRLKSSQ
jgi:hypothetical protein